VDPQFDDRPLTGGDIGTLHHAINRRIEAAIRRAGFEGVTLAHKPIFLNLLEPRRIGELAELAGVTKNAAVYLVNQLEHAGYVERVADPSDGRATVVRLTARGAQVSNVVGGTLTDMAREWQAVIGEDNWMGFRRLLRQLATHESREPAPKLARGRRPSEAV
jgi:DNA-binding MarR family transcriptional regulator